MPTTTETKFHYLPRHQQLYKGKESKYILKSNDSFVKPINVSTVTDTNLTSVDISSLIEIPSKSVSKSLWIAIISIGTFIVVACGVTIPVALILTKSSTTNISTTTVTSTTTSYPYPTGISLLSPGTPLLSMSNPSSSSSYYNVSWIYYAQGYNETLTFAIQNNPSSTQIDDVSVLYGTQQLLCNGGFENASMTCWQGASHLSGGGAHTGTYCYSDGVVGSPDYVWQTFNTIPGALLYITFWTAWGGSGGGIYTNVIIYP